MDQTDNTLRVNGKAVPELSSCLAILLAGGRGRRLHELTDRECKPALAFGDGVCLADFSLSNATNSGIRHIMIATQYRPWQLHAHLAQHWRAFLKASGGALDVRHGPSVTRLSGGYAGTAAAIADNIAYIDAVAPRDVLILAADHVYRMDYRPMLAAHRVSGADLTVAAVPVPRHEASGFGIIDAAPGGHIHGFLEKPADPPAMPGDPARALASMGVYVFRWAALRAALIRDRARPGSCHDFGFDIVPDFVAAGQAQTYAFQDQRQGQAGYWRDVGTLDAYRRAHLECLGPQSPLAHGAGFWPILPQSDAPVMPVSRDAGSGRSFLAASAWIGRAEIRNSVVMAGARIGAGSRLVDCIIGPGAEVSPGTIIGEDCAEDACWFRRSPGGTVLATGPMLKARREQRPDRVVGFVPTLAGGSG